MAEVSIIIPCFNADRWINGTLRSALEQDCDKEIIVIDDGSTDDSADIIKKDFPSVRLIESEQRGASAARNIGTRESKGEFIQYLDADDMLAPGKLKIQLESLRKTRADVAYGDWQKLINAESGKYVKGEVVSRRIQNPEIDLFTTDSWCPMAAYLFRRSIVEKMGGWNERLPVIEDVRFQTDCALSGAKFIYCPGVMGYFRVHYKDSLSTRDPIEFVRCCLLNAGEMEEWWTEHGGIDAERKAALIRAYEYIARASFENDRPTFESTHEALERLNPGYIPERPKYLRFVSLLFGYRNAEKIAIYYRHIKNFVKV